MLLGHYSASGMFSRNQTAPGPRSEKTDPGAGPGLFFGCTTLKPNTQDTTNPTLRSTSRVTVGTMHLRFTIGSTVRSSMVQLSLWRSFTSNTTYTCLVLDLSPILLYSSLPLPFFIFFNPTEINSVNKWPRDVEAAARIKPITDFLFI